MPESTLQHLLTYPLSDSAAYKKVRAFLEAHPRATRLITRFILPFEKAAKIPVFHCHMCGQCMLHYNGMTCPMNCPKNIRNGPCGGVRPNGHCEVNPEKFCVWYASYHRSKRLSWWHHEFYHFRPPVDWSLAGSSSWINYLMGRDFITSGCADTPKSALEVVKTEAAKEAEGAHQ